MTDTCSKSMNIVTTKENGYSPETQHQTLNAFLISETAGDDTVD